VSPVAIAERPIPDPGGGHETRRLELVDALLAAADGEACAATVLDWLTRHCGVERGLCAVVDRAAGALVGLAGRGLPASQAAAFRLDLDSRDHPLAVVLGGREPVHFRRERGKSGPQFVIPLGDHPFLAVPIHSGGGDRPVEHGLLLLAGPADRGREREAGWAAAVLAIRLAALELPLGLAEERRHERELTLLRRGLETVTDPILITDAEGRILVANRRAEQLLTAEDRMSEGRRRAVAMNNMLFSAAAFTGAPSDEPTRRELLLVDPIEGEDLLFELLSTRFEIGRGETGTVSILRDVTDLRRASQEIEDNYRRLRIAEARTRAERDRLDLILDAALDPILVTDREGNLARVNPPAERLFAVPEAADSEAAERRVRANDVVLASFLSELATAQFERLRGELTLTDPVSGESIPMEARAANVVSRQGEVTAVVTIFHDLSEAVEKERLYEQVKRHSEELERRVREATAELAEQNEVLRRQALELEQASALKSQFLANVSHELRTPLNAIIGYAALLLEGISGELAEPQREKLTRLESNAQSLLAIINDLLDIARIEAGKMILDVHSFDALELIDEVMAEVEPLIDRSRLGVTREINDEIPELASDRQKVKQILINLLSNALKFTPRGAVWVRAGFDPATDLLRVAVVDTGIGIRPENRISIFEAFGQSGGSVLRRQGGTGLGLSISRRLARMLGGDIHLESEVGVGSTFTLELPRMSSES
jgi:PAS domain S-box-containing protein